MIGVIASIYKVEKSSTMSSYKFQNVVVEPKRNASTVDQRFVVFRLITILFHVFTSRCLLFVVSLGK